MQYEGKTRESRIVDNCEEDLMRMRFVSICCVLFPEM